MASRWPEMIQRMPPAVENSSACQNLDWGPQISTCHQNLRLLAADTFLNVNSHRAAATVYFSVIGRPRMERTALSIYSICLKHMHV